MDVDGGAARFPGFDGIGVSSTRQAQKRRRGSAALQSAVDGKFVVVRAGSRGIGRERRATAAARERRPPVGGGREVCSNPSWLARD